MSAVRPACQGADPELFFPLNESAPAARARAFAHCRVCPLRAACLEVALAEGHVGLWAGTSTDDRRRIRSRAA